MHLIVFSFYLIIIILSLFRCRIGMNWYWLAMLCYPSWLLVNMMPMNIGMDDILISVVFISAVCYSRGILYIRYPVYMTVIFCILLFLGDFSTYIVNKEYDSEFIGLLTKKMLKSFALFFTVYSICSNVFYDERLIKKNIKYLFGAMGVSGFFVCFYSIFKDAYNPFQYPYWVLYNKEEWGFKALGPFLEHDIAGGVLGFLVIISYFIIKKGGVAKNLYFAVIGILGFVALLVSGSRSGWLFVMTSILVSIIFDNNRLKSILLVVLGLTLFIWAYSSFDYFSNRLEKTVDQWQAGTMQERTSGRFNIWQEHLDNPNFLWLMFGEGFTKEETHPHSNYIGMLVDMGAAGIIYWFFYYMMIFKMLKSVIKYEYDEFLANFFIGTKWAYIAYFVYFITCTPIMWPAVRVIDFALMSFICLRHKQLSCTQYTIDGDMCNEECKA